MLLVHCCNLVLGRLGKAETGELETQTEFIHTYSSYVIYLLCLISNTYVLHVNLLSSPITYIFLVLYANHSVCVCVFVCWRWTQVSYMQNKWVVPQLSFSLIILAICNCISCGGQSDTGHWYNTELLSQLLSQNDESSHHLRILSALWWEHKIYSWQFWNFQHMVTSYIYLAVQFFKKSQPIRHFPPSWGLVLYDHHLPIPKFLTLVTTVH